MSVWGVSPVVRISKVLNQLSPYDRYQMPFFGKTFKAVDQYADAQRMYADYMRNVGRPIKYSSFRDPRYTTSSVGDAVISGASQISGYGKTVRSLI